MSTRDNTQLIGEQSIINGAQIEQRTPSQFSFPSNDDPRKDNIVFNTDDHWIITTVGAHEGDSLPEGDVYEYGESIDVKATWWKRVQSIIWVDGTHNELTTARTDLMNHVTVTVGHQPSQSAEGKYSFFSDGDDVNFNVTGATSGVVTVSSRSYRFVGWSSELPPFFELPNSNTFSWDSQNVAYLHSNVAFSPYCIKNEYACFINGANPEILVRTNDDGTNGWNNDSKKQYILTWDDSTTYTQSFNSNPAVTGWPTYNGPEVNSRVGHYFRLITHEANAGELLTIEGADHRIYELKGWYVGDFDGFDEDEYTDDIESSDNFYPYNQSQCIYAISQMTVVTAVYMPSAIQYKIYYHSGLPEAPTQ